MIDHWLSTYFFRTPPWSEFLIEFLFPLVSEWKQRGSIHKYFFIRYFEGGPHIRLRVAGNCPSKLKELKEELKARYLEYVKLNPSHHPLLTNKNEPTKEQVDSLRFEDYEPEIMRYGGEKGIQIAESLFFHSSSTVLRFLRANPEPDYDQAMAFALLMHLCLGHALGLSESDFYDFAKYIKTGWLPKALSFASCAAENQRKNRISVVSKRFDEAYASQKDLIYPFLVEVWEQLKTSTPLQPEYLQNWRNNSNDLGHQIHQLIATKSLNMRPIRWIDYLEISCEEKEYFSIFESYCHMTNNRLGICNADEAFLGFLLEKFFSELCSTIKSQSHSHKKIQITSKTEPYSSPNQKEQNGHVSAVQ